MAKEKKVESKVVLSREYIVPLRKGWLKVPKYKRSRKTVKTLKEFLVNHMKVYDKDLGKIKLDVDLNNEMRFRGEKKPPARIKVKAVKYDDGIVRVELVDIPDVLKFKRSRELKKKAKAVVESGKKTEKVEEKKEEKTEEEKKEEKKSEKEKQDSVAEAGVKRAKEQAKSVKHTTKVKEEKIQRKALGR
mgnify:CR=1 FL=1|jgi:large subunit ribosomal protein L31e